MKKKKEIIFLTQYFYPDITATGQLLTELASDLTKLGLYISVYTSQPNYAIKKKMPKYEIYEGVNIIRVPSTKFSKDSKIGKILNSLTFFISIFFKLLFSRNCAPLLIVSNPPFLPLVGWILRKIKGQKYLFLVHDIYPDIAVQLGYLKEDSLITNIWHRINKLIYTNATQIICLGRHMKNIINKKIGNSEKVDIKIIHNWADEDKIKPLEKKDNWFNKKYNLIDKFVVLYSGNHGLFHDLEIIIEAADSLRDNKHIVFLFIGDGGKKNKLIKMVEQRKLNNVIFLPYQSKNDIPYSLASADISLVTLGKGVEGLAVPSKLYSALAVGKPIITIMDEKSETARIVKEYNCGFTLEPGDVAGLVSLILKLSKEKELFNSLGENARKCFESHFSRNIIINEYYKTLQQI